MLVNYTKLKPISQLFTGENIEKLPLSLFVHALSFSFGAMILLDYLVFFHSFLLLFPLSMLGPVFSFLLYPSTHFIPLFPVFLLVAMMEFLHKIVILVEKIGCFCISYI